MRYCTVMCVLCTACSLWCCVETVLLYAGLCHHYGLPRVQVTHIISTARHACTPSDGEVYLVIMDYMYTVKHRWCFFIGCVSGCVHVGVCCHDQFLVAMAI